MTATFPLTTLALYALAFNGVMEREGRPTVHDSVTHTTIRPERALPGEKGKLPADFMLPVVRLFGLEPCDYTKSWYAEDRVYASLNIGNPVISCSVWPTHDRQQFAFAGRIAQNGLHMPVVGYVSRGVIAGQMPRAVVVYIVGGPGGDIAPGLNDMLPTELVRRGYAVIKLGYSGTRYGSAYPKPDFDMAAHELRAYVRSFARQQPNTPLTVVGESLGAQIVEHALTPDLTSQVRSVALVHPLLFSPTAALRNFKEKVGVSDVSDSLMTIQSTDSTGTPLQTSASTLRRFAAFYPADAQNKTLAQYITENITMPTLLAYGDADTRIGVQLLPALRTHCPNVTVLTLPGINHTISETEARVIAEALGALDQSDGKAVRPR